MKRNNKNRQTSAETSKKENGRGEIDRLTEMKKHDIRKE